MKAQLEELHGVASALYRRSGYVAAQRLMDGLADVLERFPSEEDTISLLARCEVCGAVDKVETTERVDFTVDDLGPDREPHFVFETGWNDFPEGWRIRGGKVVCPGCANP